MTFNSPRWFPIAVVLAVVNVVAAWFTDGGIHAMSHAALAVGFGLWAHRLRSSTRGFELGDGLEALEIEVTELRQELAQAQERLDFAERILAGNDARRV